MTDKEFDFLVIGSGGAGLAAAVAGRAFGLSVAVLEKADCLGGGTADSLGTIWAPNNSLAAAAGLVDDIEAALEYARFVAGGQGSDENVQAYVKNAALALDAFLAAGVDLRLALELPDYFHPAPGGSADGRRMVEAALLPRADLKGSYSIRRGVQNPPGVAWSEMVSWGGFARRRDWPAGVLEQRAREQILGCGEALIGQLLLTALRLGVAVKVKVGTDELLTEGGRVVGVRLTDGTSVRARRGVVLACGGYEGDAEAVRRYEGLPCWMNPFAPSNTGDGLRLGTELGAALARVAVNNSLFVGCAAPGQPDAFFSVGLRGLPFPGAIAVNEQGERFCDESVFQDVVMAMQRYDRSGRRFANLPAYMIFDDEARARYPIATAPPGAPAHPDIVRASSLTALAELIGIDGERLPRTVKAFNLDAAEGRDRAFGRGRLAFSRSNSGDTQLSGNPQLAPLETPPFYALPLKLGGVCSTGLLTDENGCVRHVRGHPIPGLYACGNTAAPTFLGVGYQGGASIGAGMVFGYLTAQHAANAA
ncbi:MAG: FAD-binding protein [Hyphomonadaceae bacterium]|nr:FAD-binding protein [Hyphomonadaceae bacterium]